MQAFKTPDERKVVQDGRLAVVVLFDSTVTVWNLERQEPAVVLQQWGRRDEASGHTGGVNAGYISRDGTQVNFAKSLLLGWSMVSASSALFAIICPLTCCIHE